MTGRQIWNQHTYHVTNVREDATIPQFEQPHWDKLNTFRTNARWRRGRHRLSVSGNRVSRGKA
jgi:hypothetical protein